MTKVIQKAEPPTPIEKPVGKKPETIREVKPPQKESIPDYAKGYTDGIKTGFAMGLQMRQEPPNLTNERRIAFDRGVKHIVTQAENYLVKELKLASRSELAQSGKIPAWWMSTLVTEFTSSEGQGVENKEPLSQELHRQQNEGGEPQPGSNPRSTSEPCE